MSCQVVLLNLTRVIESLNKNQSQKVDELLNSDVFYLMSQVNLSHISVDLFNKIICLFDLLIDECYKDLKVSQNPKTCTCVNFLLIAFTRYNNLSKIQVISILEIVSNIADLFLIRPELINSWFHKVKEPDSVYVIHSLKLVSKDDFILSTNFSYLPIYDLLRDFLFMESSFHQVAKEGLIKIILVSNNSNYLQDWILSSDFPSIIITGLLSTFNELCYNSNLIVNLKENSLINKSAFRSYEDYVLFFLTLIQESSNEVIQVIFLNSFHENFLMRTIDYYFSHEINHQINIIFLVSYTIELIIKNTSEQQKKNAEQTIFNLLTSFLIECFRNEKFSQIILNSLLNDTSSQLNIIALKLINNVILSKNSDLIKKCFCNNERVSNSSVNLNSNYGGFNELRLKTMNIMINNEKVLINFFESSTERYKKNQLISYHQLSNYLQYNPQKKLPSVISFYLMKFFSNTPEVNKVLSTVVLDICCFNQGKIINFILNDEYNPIHNKSFTDIFKILEFLYNASISYESQLFNNLNQEYIVELKINDHTIEAIGNRSFNNTNSIISEEIVNWKMKLIEINRKKLISNLKLFQKLYIEIYTCLKLRNIIFSNDKSAR